MGHENFPVYNLICVVKPKMILEDLIEKYGHSKKIIVLLLADPFNDEVGQYFGNRLECFDIRTGNDIDIFCPGY